MKTWLVAIISALCCAPVAAQWLTHPTPGIPRTADGRADLTALVPSTADGRPDLSGLWSSLRPDAAHRVDLQVDSEGARRDLRRRSRDALLHFDVLPGL